MTSLSRIQLAPRAARVLRRLDGPARRRVREALEQLAAGAGNLEAISGHRGWLRLRVGEYRVLYRPLGRREAGRPPGWLVARVVDRKELERALDKLP